MIKSKVINDLIQAINRISDHAGVDSLKPYIEGSEIHIDYLVTLDNEQVSGTYRLYSLKEGRYKKPEDLINEMESRLTLIREICAYFNEFGTLKPEWLATGQRHKGSAAEQSDRDSWATPDWLFRFFDKHYGPFTLDAAASAHNKKCEKFLTEEQDGRNIALWQGHSAVWINPPFSGIQEWLEAAFNYSHAGENTVCVVVPDDISPAWFQYAVTHAAEMYGLISDGESTGRVGFINAQSGKPVKGNNKGTFVFVFRKRKRQIVTRWYSRFDMENLF